MIQSSIASTWARHRLSMIGDSSPLGLKPALPTAFAAAVAASLPSPPRNARRFQTGLPHPAAARGQSEDQMEPPAHPLWGHSQFFGAIGGQAFHVPRLKGVSSEQAMTELISTFHGS